MTIGGIGQASYSTSVLGAVYGANSNTTSSTAVVSGNKKDSATISDAAKKLAAQGNAHTSQEEATESASEKLREQASGTDTD